MSEIASILIWIELKINLILQISMLLIFFSNKKTIKTTIPVHVCV